MEPEFLQKVAKVTKGLINRRKLQ